MSRTRKKKALHYMDFWQSELTQKPDKPVLSSVFGTHCLDMI